MAEREALTAAYVRSILDYDPETGVFTWRFRSDVRPQWNARFAVTTAGYINTGYVKIGILGRVYLAHHLAWLLTTGKWPQEQIDHADLDKTNNRFSNLREASRSDNCRNVKKLRTNNSGYKGVSWHKSSMKWNARIMAYGMRINLGYFNIKSEASAAYAEAAKKYHGEFARSS